MAKSFSKTENDVLDYKFDFATLTNGSGPSDWLGSGETISSHTITADTGVTIDSSSITDAATSVSLTVSGGTAGKRYTITCQIVTSSDQTKEKSMELNIVSIK